MASALALVVAEVMAIALAMNATDPSGRIGATPSTSKSTKKALI